LSPPKEEEEEDDEEEEVVRGRPASLVAPMAVLPARPSWCVLMRDCTWERSIRTGSTRCDLRRKKGRLMVVGAGASATGEPRGDPGEPRSAVSVWGSGA
jgi:hypothetical protein